MLRYLAVLFLLQSCTSGINRRGDPAAPSTNGSSERTAGPTATPEPSGIAIAEAPKPPQAPEPQIEPPTVEHTAVVVGNGREILIQSIWLRASPDNELIKSAVEFVTAHDKTGSITTRVVGDYRYSCLTRNPDLQNDYIKDMFRRFALADQEAGTEYFQGFGACDMENVPKDLDFSQGIFNEFRLVSASGPNYSCHGNQWFLFYEGVDSDNQITAHGDYLKTSPFENLRYDLDQFVLSMNPVNGPKFTFSNADVTFAVEPYVKQGEGVLAQLKLNDSTEELSCRLHY
ncbi:MAG: hypothetical protein V4655_08935 [Bdellovibrionota bacterium]